MKLVGHGTGSLEGDAGLVRPSAQYDEPLTDAEVELLDWLVDRAVERYRRQVEHPGGDQ